ncbi:hypothetical protein KAR91_03950 [Candidatus Pacearchaeota archaeon]|nr:hypothetical protein [Candidatus Pacearchaeota archaeon]
MKKGTKVEVTLNEDGDKTKGVVVSISARKVVVKRDDNGEEQGFYRKHVRSLEKVSLEDVAREAKETTTDGPLKVGDAGKAPMGIPRKAPPADGATTTGASTVTAKVKSDLEDGLVRLHPDHSHYTESVSEETGKKTYDVGDATALALRSMALPHMYAIVDMVGMGDMREKYAGLNHGMQRMNLGNKLRAAIKREGFATLKELVGAHEGGK